MKSLLRHKTDVALVLVAAILAVVVIVDRGSITTAEAEERRYMLVDAWRPDDITRLDIAVDGRTMLLNKVDGSWNLRQDGEDVTADDQAVGNLLVSLEFASFERTTAGLDVATTGLDQPRMTFIIHMGSLSYALKVGNEAPSPAGAAYVEVSGGRRGKAQYVVRAELVAELAVERGALRSRHLASYLSPQLRSLELTGHFELVRGTWGGRTAGAFFVTSSAVGKVRANRRALDGWLAVLGHLDAERFVPIPDADAKDAATLVLTPIDGERKAARLMLGGACPDGAKDQVLVVRREPEPVAGCVARKLVEQLLIDGDGLADRYVVGTAEGDITEIQLSAADVQVEMARSESGWRMRKPTEGPAEREPADKLIAELALVRGRLVAPQDTSDLEALGLTEPQAEITIRGLPERTVDAAKARTERISVGHPRGEHVFVRRHDDDAVIQLPVEDARTLLPRPSALRASQIYDFPIERVQQMRLDCGRRQRMTRSIAGAWTLQEPELTLGVDIGLANGFVERFRQLRAVRWVSEEAEPSHGLDKPWCTVEIDYQRQQDGEAVDETHRVYLGGETRGGYFARHDDDPAVFVAPKGVGSQAARWMLDRSAILVPLRDVAKVELRSGDAVLERDGATLGPALEGLGELIAEGVMHLGSPKEGAGFDNPLLRIEITRQSTTEPLVMIVGRGEAWHNTSIYRLRRSGVDATFAVARSRLQPLIDAL